jgi:CBS domain-containing protein
MATAGIEGLGQVRDWMSRRPVTVAPGCPVGQVARRMQAERIRHVIVLDGDRVEGIASNRDVRVPLVADEPHVLPGSPVSRVMTEQPVTASPETPLVEAARTMLERKIGALPVVEAGRLVGILTKSDVLEAMLMWIDAASRGAAAPRRSAD